MDHISDGIEWRSEQQELSLWLYQQAGARGGPGLHGPPAWRRGRLREPWNLDTDGERAAYQPTVRSVGEEGKSMLAARAGARGRKEDAPELGGGSR
jgi:hypothetical protein